MIILCLVLALAVVNALTATLWAIDKARAVAGEWRISEATLLSLALMGGWPAALWARQRFRHKTRKQPFATQLDVIAMLHVGVAGGLAIAWVY